MINFKEIDLKETIKKYYDFGEEETKQILIYNKKNNRYFLKNIKEISLNKQYMEEYIKGNYVFYETSNKLESDEILSLFKVLKSNIEIRKIENIDWLYINGVRTIILTYKQVKILKDFYKE